MNFSNLGDLVVLSVRDPATAFRILQGLRLPLPVRWMVMVLAATLAALLVAVIFHLFPADGGELVTAITMQPISYAGMQLMGMVIMTAAITFIGRLFGGTGTFPDAMLIIGWVEMLMVVSSALQIVLALVFPAAAQFVVTLSIGLALYLLVTMTKALHGFASMGKVILGFIGSMFGMAILLTIVLTALGVTPEVPA